MREFTNLDADLSMFFQRELEFIKAKTYDVQYPELLARQLFPVESSVDTGASTLVYQTYDHLGVAKIIKSYATDLPNVSATAKESIRKIYSAGVAYGYSVQDIRAARFAGKPLEQRLANAARRQYMYLENQLAFFGDATTDIPGFVNNANTISVTIKNNAAATSKLWINKTPDEIIEDVSDMVAAIRDTTNGVETPNTLLLPEAQYTLIATTPRSSVSDTTILRFLLASNPFITQIIPVYNLKGAGASTTDVMILYDRNPDKLTLEVPQDFEQFPVQEKGLMYEVPCHARTAGVVIYYPKSVAQGNGI